MAIYHPNSEDDLPALPQGKTTQPAALSGAGKRPRISMTSHSQASGYPKAFTDRLNGLITHCITEQKRGALLMLSIENLPMIMNGFGVEASEQVVRHIEGCIADIVGKQDIICRLQRDVFGILIQNRKQNELDYLALHLKSHIHQWCSNNDYGQIHAVTTLASVRLPEQARHADEALSKAYLALHDRSMAAGAMRVFEERHEEAAFSRQEMALASYLTQAIAEERLLMAYQPIVSAKDGSVKHYEALLRIRSDDGKVSSAGALIPIAERMGLIDAIDVFALHNSVQELRRSEDLHIAFNVSNLTTHNDAWLKSFFELLTESPEIAPRLTVEITETAAQIDLQRAAHFVAEVQALGCMVALDDFGSGYTSFRQLKTLSVDIVKIDGSFIKDLAENADNRFFVKTLLDFTNGFGLQSVAEFVENGEVAKLLMELGVDMLQGYYFGKPEIGKPWEKHRR